MTLSEIGKLVGTKPGCTLVEKVAECITNPVEIRKLEAKASRLHEEVDTLKAKLFAIKEDITATKEMADEIKKVAGEVKVTFGESGSMAVKARMFDEGVLQDKKLSSARVVRILSDFAEQVETIMVGTREAANRMEESSQKLTGMMNSKEVRLSDLSLPEFFLGKGE